MSYFKIEEEKSMEDGSLFTVKDKAEQIIFVCHGKEHAEELKESLDENVANILVINGGLDEIVNKLTPCNKALRELLDAAKAVWEDADLSIDVEKILEKAIAKAEKTIGE